MISVLCQECGRKVGEHPMDHDIYCSPDGDISIRRCHSTYHVRGRMGISGTTDPLGPMVCLECTRPLVSHGEQYASLCLRCWMAKHSWFDLEGFAAGIRAYVDTCAVADGPRRVRLREDDCIGDWEDI